MYSSDAPTMDSETETPLQRFRRVAEAGLKADVLEVTPVVRNGGIPVKFDPSDISSILGVLSGATHYRTEYGRARDAHNRMVEALKVCQEERDKAREEVVAYEGAVRILAGERNGACVERDEARAEAEELRAQLLGEFDPKAIDYYRLIRCYNDPNNIPRVILENQREGATCKTVDRLLDDTTITYVMVTAPTFQHLVKRGARETAKLERELAETKLEVRELLKAHSLLLKANTDRQEEAERLKKELAEARATIERHLSRLNEREKAELAREEEDSLRAQLHDLVQQIEEERRQTSVELTDTRQMLEAVRVDRDQWAEKWKKERDEVDRLKAQQPPKQYMVDEDMLRLILAR